MSRWKLTPITPPPVYPVTLAQAKAQLRLDHTDEDELIETLIAAATKAIDGRDGTLGRALVTQTWEMTKTGFYGEDDMRITIPLPPLQDIVSIKYIDLQGIEQTLATDAYQLLDGEPSVIVPAYSTTWPPTRMQPDTVKIRFTAGYEPGEGSPTDYAENVPDGIQHAILLTVAHWYENRVPINIGNIVNAIPMTVGYLLAPYKVSCL